MKHRWLIPLLLLSLGLNLGLLIIRFSPSLRPPPPDLRDILRAHLTRMTEDLGLGEEQRNKLRINYDRIFPDIFESSAHVKQLRQELAKTYAAPQFDPEKIKELLRQLNAAHSKLDSLIAKTILVEASILSTEQRRLYLKRMPWKISSEGPGQHHQGKPVNRREESPLPKKK